ncbi:MAG: hypothetical protein K5695_03865 [Oscillospiraceae bacterium]|nr:hypothetical protein [Oscillospiraceae bacterium]
MAVDMIARAMALDAAAGGEGSAVQADWSQTDSSADDYIKNKPPLGTAAALNMDSTLNARSGNPVQNSVITLELNKLLAGIVGVLDNGAKNRLDPNNACGYYGQGAAFPITVGGVTFTLGSDGSISTSGTPATDITLRIPITLQPGSYHFSGCPANGSDSSYWLDLRHAGYDSLITQSVDYGDGIYYSFLYTPMDIDVCLHIAAGYDPSSVVFRPMICTTNDWYVSQAFVPYCPSIAELYAMIQALQS